MTKDRHQENQMNSTSFGNFDEYIMKMYNSMIIEER